MPKVFLPTIECAACGGSGRVQLPDHLLRTLLIVKAAKAGVVACEVAAQLDFDGHTIAISSNAASNRLSALLELGFVHRQREGKTWVYKPKALKMVGPKEAK